MAAFLNVPLDDGDTAIQNPDESIGGPPEIETVDSGLAGLEILAHSRDRARNGLG